MEANQPPPHDSSQSPLPPVQTHYQHRSYSGGLEQNLESVPHDLPGPNHAYPVHHTHAPTTGSAGVWPAQPPVGWWPERSTNEVTPVNPTTTTDNNNNNSTTTTTPDMPPTSMRHETSHNTRHHSDTRTRRSTITHRSQLARDYPHSSSSSSSSSSSTTADEGSDGGEWTDGRSRTARAADKVKLQRTAPPLLRSIKSDQSKRMSHETAPINMANYPVMHKHNITESEFPTIERQYDPFRGFELVFVDPLDVTVRYWWPAMVIPPEQIDRYMRLPYPGHDECLVRYFEDNKFSMVKMKDLVLFTLNTEPYLYFSRNLPEFLEDSGVRRATRYLHTGILPKKFPWKAWREMASSDYRLIGYRDTFRLARLAHIKDPEDIPSHSEREENGVESDHPDGEGVDGARVKGGGIHFTTTGTATTGLFNQRSILATTGKAIQNGSDKESNYLENKPKIPYTDSTSTVSTSNHPQTPTRRGRGNYRGGYGRRRVEHEEISTEKRVPYQRPPTRPPDVWDYIRYDEHGQSRNADEREALYQSGFERLSELQTEYRQLKRTTRELAKELVGRHENGGAITRSRRRKLAL